jgi:hypothetical protein
MVPSKDKPPTYDEVIAELLRTVSGPVPVAQLARRMLAARPSSARKPVEAMRQRLREAVGRLLVFTDPDTVLLLRLAHQGVRFRLPLDRDTVKRGLVSIGDSLYRYLPWDFPPERLRFLDAASRPIVFQVRRISKEVETPVGRTDAEKWYADLGDWLRAEKAIARDHLLVTFVDWEQGIFRLEREPWSHHDPARRAARNRLLADIFYELLESAKYEQIFTHEAVPTAYARLPEKGGYPPDHWVAVVAADERLDTDGWQIRYRDSRPTIFDLLEAEAPLAAKKRSFRDQGAQVYRFKAALAFRVGLWRTVEIQGKHTLADLDRALRLAFNHDVLDHLGGFWKLVPRGAQARLRDPTRSTAKRTRFREVALGDVNPFGESDGADVKIASVELAVGDQLKYVYDFGDWIEHRLILEAITPPEPRVKYPREVARNKPRYAPCVECQAKSRQSVARWICLECSNHQGEAVRLCDACARKRHEEHYIQEILY